MMNISSERPAYFQKSNSAIWTDAYIQHNLLQAHLDTDNDAATRKPDTIRKTVNWLDQHIAPSGTILDLGCGPGLYAELLADKKHQVTGIDFNTASIQYARQQLEKTKSNIHYIENDYITNYPAGCYDLVMMIYCDMCTHSDDERDLLIKKSYDSLNSGGKLIFDVFNESLMDNYNEEQTWEYHKDGGFWSKSEYLLLKQTFKYKEHNAVCHQYNIITQEGSEVFILWEKCYSKNEIIEVVKEAGFKNVTIEENIVEEVNFKTNDILFVVAEKN